MKIDFWECNMCNLVFEADEKRKLGQIPKCPFCESTVVDKKCPVCKGTVVRETKQVSEPIYGPGGDARTVGTGNSFCEDCGIMLKGIN